MSEFPSRIDSGYAVRKDKEKPHVQEKQAQRNLGIGVQLLGQKRDFRRGEKRRSCGETSSKNLCGVN
jgi:hypothetical protein